MHASCAQADAAPGAIEVNESFASGDDAPPGHPRCRCSVPQVFEDDLDRAFNPAQPRDAQGRWTSGLSALLASLSGPRQGTLRAMIGPTVRVAQIRHATGIDMRGFRHTLSSDGVAHVMNRHGRDKHPVTASDFALAGQIVRSPDRVIAGVVSRANGQPRMIFEKQIGSRLHTYVGEVQRGKRRIGMVAMWKR